MADAPDPRLLARTRRALLDWYEPRRRAYPWRITTDPYRILVSEVMLQQTQAPRVVHAYRAFLKRFPSVRALAGAPRREVLVAWDGLGYNRRAVALSDAARAVVAEYHGRVPSDTAALQTLRGVGPYTSAAVASIAFGAPVAAVDTNVRRIVGRVLDGADDVSLGRARALAQAWIDRAQPGDWNQALMDLGREVCRPRPRCGVCTLQRWCGFARSGATPSAARRRQEPFEGSARQVRGAVVRALRSRPSLATAELASLIGSERERIDEAVRDLEDDGIVWSRRGRVRLAE